MNRFLGASRLIALALALLVPAAAFAQTLPPTSVQMSDGSYRNGGTTALHFPDTTDGHARVVRPGDPLPVGSTILTPSATFTRPNDTTAYVIGDLMANSTTAGSVTPLSWTVGSSNLVLGAYIATSNTALVSAAVTLHLHTASPTFANGDNGAWSVSTSGWFCDITVTLSATAFTNGVSGYGVPNSGPACAAVLASGTTVYGELETRTGFTPVAQSTWTVTLVDQANAK